MATAPNTETYSQVDQITDGNADGTVIGTSTEKIALYGRTPLPQRAYTELIPTGTATSAVGINIGTSIFTTAAASSPAQLLAATAFTSLFGNWSYGTAVTTGAASTTVGVTGLAYFNTLLGASTTAGSSLPTIQPAALAEVCRTLVGLGIWRGYNF